MPHSVRADSTSGAATSWALTGVSVNDIGAHSRLVLSFECDGPFGDSFCNFCRAYDALQCWEV